MAKRKKRGGSNRPGARGASYTTPPFLSHDPAIGAERRAAERGLEDLEFDVRRQGKRSKKDYRTERRLLGRDYGRGREDIGRNLMRDLQDLGLRESDAGREYGRGLEDIGTRRGDIETEFGRGREDLLRDFTRSSSDLEYDYRRGKQDFGFQLEALGRRYNRLGQAQGEATNAAGVGFGGSAAASAAKRAENQAFERKPIDTASKRLGEDYRVSRGRLGSDFGTGQSRLSEDYRRNLGLLERTGARLGQDFGSELERIGMARGRSTEDASRGQHELGQDYRTDRGLLRRGFKRGRQDLRTEVQRGRREQAIGDVDLQQQAIWQARMQQPGTFTRLGKKKSRKGKKQNRGM